MKRINLYVLMVLGLALLVLPKTTVEAIPLRPYAHGSFFIPNHGQYDASVLFYGYTDHGPIGLTADGLWMFTGKHIDPHRFPDRFAADETPRIEATPLQVRFKGANPAPLVEAFDPLATEVAYFIGDDPTQWETHVPTWGGVRYRNLYPGIDMEFASSAAGSLSRRLVASPSADLSQVQLEIVGVETIEVTPDGLSMTTAVGNTTLPLFEVVLTTGTSQRPSGEPSLNGKVLSHPFALAAPADLDDNFVYYNTFNGANNEWVQAIEAIDTGEAFISGVTYSTNFPVTGTPFRGGPNDAFVGGLNADGSVKFMTFFGGGGREEAYALEYDSTTNPDTLVVAGYTNSLNFPADGYDTDDPSGSCTFGQAQEPCYDVFVSRVSLDGQAIPDSTYIGGDRNDFGYGLVAEDDGDIHFTGQTNSVTEAVPYPTTSGALQSTSGGGGDAFVSRFNGSLSVLEASTYLGGSGLDNAYAIALDRDGAPYVTGRTDSSNFPTDPAGSRDIYDFDYNGNGDMYISVFNQSSNLGSLYYSTYIGNTELDYGTRIVVENDYDAYVIGSTRSANFPFPSQGQWLDNTHGGDLDAVLIRMSPFGDALEYATFWGGSGVDYGSGLYVDPSNATNGDVYFAGDTASANLRTTLNAYQRQLVHGTAGFLVKANITGSPPNGQLLYSTYMARSGATSVFDIDVDPLGRVYGGGFDGTTAMAFKLKIGGAILIPMMKK